MTTGSAYRPAICVRCGEKSAVMWTPGDFVHGYYCEDHIPIGFNGMIPEDLRIENEPLGDMLP